MATPGGTAPAEGVDITALVCVYNGVPVIEESIGSILAQRTDGLFSFEVLAIDNNSTDGTPALLQKLEVAHGGALRVMKEGRQGKSYALNTGLQAARGQIVSVIDDDEILPANWLAKIWEAFDGYPDAAFVGGKVLPIWPGPVPPWVTTEHWSPLAICDYGNAPRRIDRNTPLCLLAGSFRRSDLLAVGGYREDLGIRPGQLGSVEDDDVYKRLIDSGRQGIYLPGIMLSHKIERQRLTKQYHRRWHQGHGRYYAQMRLPSHEASHWPLLGVPGHAWRQAAVDARGWLACTFGRDQSRAFSHESRLHFFFGFVRNRWGL
jgi:glucosyl-dolichyl phosphate glucuronosyltransferase